MDKEEVIKSLEKLSGHAVHVIGEPPFVLSLDDGISLMEAVSLLKEQESVIEALKSDLDETLAVLSEQPEIVRCRECKHGWRMASGVVYMCESPEQNEKMCIHVHKPDWFCADGERKDNG